MSFIIKHGKSEDFSPVPAGTHLGICTTLVRLGKQPDSRFEPKDKVYIRWELPEQTITWRDKNGGDHSGPMTLGKTYTESLAPKSNLRAHLETWRGRGFTDEELNGFDLTDILGKPCMLGVVHREGGERVYADVKTVSQAPAGVDPKPATKLMAFDCDDEDPEAFALLPTWLQKKIRARIVPQAKPQPPISTTAAPDDFDDDVPF